MRTAWRATLEPVAASAGTVIAGVLCLLLSDLNSNRGLGPVAAIGIAASFVASMTFLPAVLDAVRPDGVLAEQAASMAARREGRGRDHRFWAALAARIGRHPRRFWVASMLVLVLFALLVPQFEPSGVAQSDTFLLDRRFASRARRSSTEHFDAGDGSPAVIIANPIGCSGSGGSSGGRRRRAT